MQETKTIIIDDSYVQKIERLQYEVESRKDVISQVLAGSITVVGELFDRYQKEYMDFYIQYQRAKNEMLRAYSINTSNPWKLDFSTHELEMEED